MTDSTTTYLGLTKPTVGADGNSWGDILNTDLDQVDALWVNIGDVVFGTAATKALSFFAQTANNLADLASAATARTNLGLGTAATQNTGTSGATVPLLNTSVSWTGTVTATGFVGPLTGNVTGNVSGSSASCTGNAATAAALTSGDKTITGKMTVTGDVASGGAVLVSGTTGGFTGDGTTINCNQSFASAGAMHSGGGVFISGTTGGFTGNGSQIECNQDFYGDGAGNFASIVNRSDRRIKTDIQDAPDTGALIDQFRVTTYRKAGRREMGAIAQEVEAFWPDVVVSSSDPFEDGEPLRGLCVVDIQFAMLRELQALRRRVAALERAGPCRT